MVGVSMVSRGSASARFGLLCEDDTDAEALKVLLRRIATAAGGVPGDLGIRHRSGEGCGNLRKKAGVGRASSSTQATI